MHQPLPRRPFDDQFDCQLPEEARTELLGEIPPKKAYRKPPSPPPPAKRKRSITIIGIIAIVTAFLYAVSHPSTSTVPPESGSVPTPPSSQPVEVRRALSVPPPVAVRRALPLVPRALPVTFPAPVSNTGWHSVRFPDGTTVPVSYQGELPGSAALPSRGRFIGEEWSTGNTSWIWMTPAGARFPSWVDP